MKIMKDNFNNIDIIEYCRYYDKYGLWGNISNYFYILLCRTKK